MWLALTMVPGPAELVGSFSEGCGHWSWTFDVPGRGLSVGAQNQVARSSPEMVGPKHFVPVFPTPAGENSCLRPGLLAGVARRCSQESCWAGEPVGVARAATSRALTMSLALSCPIALGSQPNEHH